MSEIRTWLLHCQVAQPCCACISVGRQDNLREVLVLDPHGGEEDGSNLVAVRQELVHDGGEENEVALGAKVVEDKDMVAVDQIDHKSSQLESHERELVPLCIH